MLLRLDPAADLAAVETRLRRRLRDVEILPAAVVKQNDLDLLVQIFAIPLRMMVAIAFAVGTAILGMIIYTATVERVREYGVLKAVGARNRQLYWLVTQQGLFTAWVGAGLGIGLAWLVGQWIMRTWPKFLVILQLDSTLAIMITGLLIGLAVTALTLYTSTLSKRPEYGVPKAIGAKNRHLFSVVIAQAFLSLLIGFTLAIGLVGLMGLVLPQFIAGFNLALTAQSIVRMLAASLVIGVVAVSIPTWQIARLDPARVFRN